jgi:hypothetical protein
MFLNNSIVATLPYNHDKSGKCSRAASVVYYDGWMISITVFSHGRAMAIPEIDFPSKIRSGNIPYMAM